VNIVVPMAGRGHRFTTQGFTLPKPLIDVDGLPMYSIATRSLPLDLATRLVFVCLQEHLDRYELESDIMSRFGDHPVTVCAVPEVTAGQLCTVLAARDAFDLTCGLAIFNADTAVESTSLRSSLARSEQGDDVDGLIGVFRAEGDHWSFVQLDATDRVIRTAEKVRISDLATTGLYYFSSTERFLASASRAIDADRTSGGEFYVAPLYNDYIADGANIRVVPAENVWPMGTPAELDSTLSDPRFRSAALQQRPAVTADERDQPLI
jgi:dTDP-glucose pyrophosphorylase